MSSIKDITKTLKRLARKKRRQSQQQMTHPQREWMIGVGLGVLMTVSGATWSFVTYNDVNSKGVETVKNEQLAVNVYREEVVTAALNEFKQRKNRFDALLHQGPVRSEKETEISSPEVENQDQNLTTSTNETIESSAPESASMESSDVDLAL